MGQDTQPSSDRQILKSGMARPWWGEARIGSSGVGQWPLSHKTKTTEPRRQEALVVNSPNDFLGE